MTTWFEVFSRATKLLNTLGLPNSGSLIIEYEVVA